jgi:hypothetical protein
MSSPTLTLDELLAEVERVHGNQPQGVSMRELCAAVGHTAKWVSDRLLRPAMASGRARFVGRRRVPAHRRQDAAGPRLRLRHRRRGQAANKGA